MGVDNLYAESGLNPQNLQNTYEAKLGFTDTTYTAAVDNGTYDGFVNDCAGYGLAQWTHPSRKAMLLDVAKGWGRSIGDLDMQVEFLLQELQALFRGVWDKLRTTSSVREASDAVLLDFERPASTTDPKKLQETKDRRAALAQEFYDKFTGGISMNFIMTAAALCAKALDIARNYKTSYMLGPWGWPATDKMITRATTNGSNAQTNKQWLTKANAIKGKGFLFDCVGLIKGILWGWCGDLSRTYGGAGYACNDVPDYDAKKMIDCCREVSTDFSRIVPGEAVWMDGHIGIYVGGGVVVESTPKWQGGVQCSTLTNTAGSQKLPGTVGSRTWTKHGKLPWVDYSAAEEINEEGNNMTEEQIRKIVRDEITKIRAEMRADHNQCWAEEELAAAIAAGITNGTRPHDLVTREEAAIMALRGMQHKE
ncbi:MAG: hypothetical protein K2M42_02895 [Oscillospiraceae bacterium]|nr:hypothetical protein [Oscillospiraceae bacterium]